MSGEISRIWSYGILGISVPEIFKKNSVLQLFLYSSWGISFLAIILLGKGDSFLPRIRLGFHHKYYDFFGRVDWLGIYPSIESIISQVLLIVAVFTLNFSSNLKRAFLSN